MEAVPVGDKDNAANGSAVTQAGGGDQTKPNPVRHGPILDPEKAPSVRRLDCRFYNSCLRDAAHEAWEGFSCGSCTAYEALGEDERRRDVEGMADMLFARGDLLRRRPDGD